MSRLVSARLRGLPRPVWILLAGTLITRAGTFAVPFLTIYLHNERGLSKSMAGLALALYGAGGMFAAAIGGTLADRLGRKPVVAGSPLLGGSAVLCLAVTQAIPMVMVIAFLAGFVAEAGRPAVTAMLTDLTPADRRIDSFALFRVVVNLGFAVGTGLGGLLIAEVGFVRLFALDAATSWICALVSLAALPETRPASTGATTTRRSGGFGQVLDDRVFRRFWLASLLAAVVFAQPMATLALALTDRGMSPSVYGGLVSLNGGIILCVEFWLAGRVRRFHQPAVLALGCAILAVGFAATPLAGTSIALLVVTVAIWTTGEMLGAPVAQAYLAAIAPQDMRGRYAGAYGLSWSLAFTIGPVLGGLALQVAGGAPLWIGSLAVGAAAAFLYRSLPAVQPVAVTEARPAAAVAPAEAG